MLKRNMAAIGKRCVCMAFSLFIAMTAAMAGNSDIDQLIDENMRTISLMNEDDTAMYVNLVRETMRMGETRGRKEVIAECQKNLVTYFFVPPHCDMDRAAVELDNFRKLTEKTGEHTDWHFILWQNYILMQYEESNILHAMMELKNMLAYAKERRDDYGLACAYTIFGYVYEEDSYEMAMENYELALKYSEKAGHKEKHAYIYQSMAHTAFYNGKYDEVFKYIDLALNSNPAPQQEQASDCLRMRAYIRIGDKAEADKCYTKLRKLWDKGEISSSYERTVAAGLCEYLCKYGDPDESVMLWKYIEEPIPSQITYYKAKNNFQKALELQEQLDSMNRNANAERQRAEIANANIFLNTQQLKDENQQLELDNANSRTILLGVIVAALLLFAVFAVYIIIIIRRHNLQLKIERDRTEEERKKAVRLSEMKTTFIKNLSHEVRTPLNSILGFNDLLNNPDMEFSTDERKEMLDGIKFQANALLNLHDNVIYLSRIDSGDIKPVIENVQLSEICQMAVYSKKKDLAPAVKLDAIQALNSYIVVNSDRNLITTAIINVLDNAMKFTSEGTITIELSELPDDPEFVRYLQHKQIVISDTGEGIPAESAELVFERFEKLGRCDAGFGLGLSIARESLALIGGTIHLDTEYTKGSRFIIRL